jgi:hypothetical protein
MEAQKLFDEYYDNITEFILHMVKYYGKIRIDDLIKLVKIYKKQDITAEDISTIKNIIIEKNFVYLKSDK